jgi:hypothetical protein
VQRAPITMCPGNASPALQHPADVSGSCWPSHVEGHQWPRAWRPCASA